MSKHMYAVNSFFIIGARSSLIREDLLEAGLLMSIQANSGNRFEERDQAEGQRCRSKNGKVRIGDSRVRIVLGYVRSLAETVPLGTSTVGRFVRDIFPPDWKIVPYNSKVVPILAIKVFLEAHKNKEDKAQDVMTLKEEHA